MLGIAQSRMPKKMIQHGVGVNKRPLEVLAAQRIGQMKEPEPRRWWD